MKQVNIKKSIYFIHVIIALGAHLLWHHLHRRNDTRILNIPVKCSYLWIIHMKGKDIFVSST